MQHKGSVHVLFRQKIYFFCSNFIRNHFHVKIKPEVHNLLLIILPEAETGQSPPLARNNVMPEVETGQSPPLAGKKVIPAAERLG